MSKKTTCFSVDSDIVEVIKPLAKTYGVNLSQTVNDFLFMVLQQLRSVDKMASANPDGVPMDVVRAHLKQQISQGYGDTQALVDELYPAPSKKKTKVKA
jgi:hypothetical protein